MIFIFHISVFFFLCSQFIRQVFTPLFDFGCPNLLILLFSILRLLVAILLELVGILLVAILLFISISLSFVLIVVLIMLLILIVIHLIWLFFFLDLLLFLGRGCIASLDKRLKTVEAFLL